MIPAVIMAAAAGYLQFCSPDLDDGIKSAALYRVLPGPRVPFYRTSNCNDASCSDHAYVVSGDRVVVYHRDGGRVCAYSDRTRETTGWIDVNRLAPDIAQPKSSDWIGDWYDGDDHIRLTPAGGGRLHVKGDAYYPSANAEQPNFGNLDGTFPIEVDRVDYSDGDKEYDCRATLRLLGKYLLVGDNETCGGHNVRFRGTYRRRPAHRPATRS